MNDRTRLDAARYLARLKERGPIAWVHPAGLSSAPGEEEPPQAPPAAPSVTPAAPSAPPASAARQADQGAGGPVHETARDAVTTDTFECPPPDPSWPHGAPEPEATIPVPGRIEDPFPGYRDLASFRAAVCNCRKCSLGKTRNKFVFGVGGANARLVLVGEAPGAEEDAQGEPFVGRAGKLLDQILAAVNLERGEDVYICNILKCRPPGNRDPLQEEVEQCEPHLVKQLQLIEPRLIVALGRMAAQVLLRTTAPLSRLRGQVHEYQGVPLLVTYHPAALLRNPNWKRPTWEDVQEMKRLLDSFGERGGGS